MFYWAFIFFLVALVAGLFGYTGIAGASAHIAQILFFIGLLAMGIVLIGGYFLSKRRSS